MVDVHRAVQMDRWNHTAWICSTVAQWSGNAKNRQQIQLANFHPMMKRSRRGISLDTPEGFQAAAEYFCGPSVN